MRNSNVAAVICGLACAVAGAFCGDVTQDEKAAIAAVQAKLEKPVSLRLLEVKVERALELLSKQADVKIRVTDKKRNEGHDRAVSMAVKDVRGLDVLAMICDTAGLDFEIGSKSVDVHAWNNGPVVMRIYDVSDLTTVNQDYPGPECGLGVYNFFDGTIRDTVFVAAPKIAPTLTNIADMIRNRIKPESWDAALGTSIEERGGKLVIMQTEAVHRLVRELLDEFRTGAYKQVFLEFRSLAVKSTDVDRIKREMAKRGAGWPDLDDEALAAVEKLRQDGAAKLLFDGSGLAYNTQRTSVMNTVGHEYLASYEVSGNNLDPVVRRYLIGTVADVRPILSDDNSLATLELRFTQTFECGPPETAVVQHAGLVSTAAGATKLTVKRTKTAAPKDQQPANGAKAPEAKGAEQQTKEEDVTNEFTLTDEGKGKLVASPGPYQLQLPTIGISRIRESRVVRTGRFSAATAPLAGKDGLVLGQEMLFLVRCTPQAPATAQRAAPPYRFGLSDVLRAKLAKPVTLEAVAKPFPEVLATLMAQLEIPYAFDPNATPFQAAVAGDVTLELKDVTGAEAMKRLAREGSAGIIPYSSFLFVTSPNAAAGRGVELRIYDIRDLTTIIPDFPGPRELKDMTRPSAGVVDPFAGPRDLDDIASADLATLIKDKLFPAEFADPATSIEESGGKLVVMQTPAVHEKIEQAIEGLRRTLTLRVGVTVRWAVVNAADLKATTGPASAGVLDAVQAEKVFDLIAQAGARDIAAARTVCFSNQRVHVLGCTERGIVVDYDVSGEVYDPVVGSVFGGAIFEVRPARAGGDGTEVAPSGIRLDFRASLSHLDKASGTFEPVAAPAAAGRTVPPAPGKIHTPVTHLQPIETTVRVPNRGAALFRLPVPGWIEGENAEAVAKGERVMMVVIQAEELKY